MHVNVHWPAACDSRTAGNFGFAKGLKIGLCNASQVESYLEQQCTMGTKLRRPVPITDVFDAFWPRVVVFTL